MALGGVEDPLDCAGANNPQRGALNGGVWVTLNLPMHTKKVNNWKGIASNVISSPPSPDLRALNPLVCDFRTLENALLQCVVMMDSIHPCRRSDDVLSTAFCKLSRVYACAAYLIRVSDTRTIEVVCF